MSDELNDLITGWLREPDVPGGFGQYHSQLLDLGRRVAERERERINIELTAYFAWLRLQIDDQHDKCERESAFGRLSQALTHRDIKHGLAMADQELSERLNAAAIRSRKDSQ